ncbi:MAG: tetratricopeptide repeat protein [Thermoanaerobaculia bacterium]
MLNTAISRDAERARNLKSLYKGVLDGLVARLEEGGWQSLPGSVEYECDGRVQTWELAVEVGAPCPGCGCDTGRYDPAGDGMTFEFCPACWSIRGRDDERGESFDVGKWQEKRERDLPPGMTIALKLGGETLPPKAPRTEPFSKTAREELDEYAAGALAPLQICRQAWMGDMNFEGIGGARQDYLEARRWFEMAARRGHGRSFATLGLIALHGLGEPRDERKAAELCRRGALRGCLEAETGLGHLYWNGIGLERDPIAAVGWWRRASRRGSREAQLCLGRALIRGEGVERDAAEGLVLVRQAADAGEAVAQYELGLLLLEGRIAPPDPVQVRAWLSKAAGQGHAGAERRLADLDVEGPTQAGPPTGR